MTSTPVPLPPHGATAIHSPAHASNNFDELRLLGALLVVVSHSIHAFGANDPLGAATNNQTLGALGLNMFCVISGYLITRSRMRRPVGPFIEARVRRLIPGLFVSVVFAAFVLGPCVTTLPLGEYFRSSETYRFLATTFVIPLNQTLPGVWGGVHLNGPLYSLTAEVVFYAFVALLGGRRIYPIACALGFVSVSLLFLKTDYVSMSFTTIWNPKYGDLTLAFFPVRLEFLCFYYLLAGSMAALFQFEKTNLRRGFPIYLIVWAVALTSNDRRVYDVVEMILYPLIILSIGTYARFTLKIGSRFGDISYGTYIYHIFVIEFLLRIGWRSTTPVMVVLAVIVSTSVGWLSYHLVEKRFAGSSSRTTPRPAGAKVVPPPENLSVLIPMREEEVDLGLTRARSPASA